MNRRHLIIAVVVLTLVIVGLYPLIRHDPLSRLTAIENRLAYG